MKMKKLLAIGCAASCAAAMMATPVFAASSEPVQQSNNTQGFIHVTKDSNKPSDPGGEGGNSALVKINVAVTEKLDFYGQADCSLLLKKGQTYKVQNNQSVGSVQVTTVGAKGASGWSLVPNSARDIKALGIGKKSLGMSFEGTDLAGNKTHAWNQTIAPGEFAETSNIQGNIAPQNQEQANENALTFTATIKMVTA